MPKQSPVVGIDLGTTFSAIAYVNPDTGHAEVIPSPEQERITPSVVLFEDANNVIVGKLAKQNAVADADKVVEFVKREMGRPREDIIEKGQVVFSGWSRTFFGKKYSAQEISALVLKKLKLDAEARLGVALSDAVITCPAYFGDNERAATKEAGIIAGFNVLGVLDEPVAAALAYGLDKLDRDQKVFVFDLGGGTFDVAILEIKGRGIRELAVNGDHRLGGKDWDDALIGHVAGRFAEKYGADPLTDNSSYQDLQLRVISLKETLSRMGSARLVCNHAGHALSLQVGREEFEELTRPLVARCRVLCDVVLGEAGLQWGGIDTVLLVGGATRMPMIREMVLQVTGKELSGELNPDECVAHGAAWQGVLLAAGAGTAQSEVRKWIPAGLSVEKVTTHNLGTDALRNGTEVRDFLMIPKFTPVPCEVKKTFCTSAENQSRVNILVLEGGEMGPDDTCALDEATKIGDAPIVDIPPSPKGSPIEITFRYNTDGILEVYAKHIPSGRKSSATVVRPGGLNQRDRDAAVQHVGKMIVSS
jgi:molecular chaperone DnaK